MWISPAYRKEYCDWIGGGLFQEIYDREKDYFLEVLADELPLPMASILGSYATCYYRRGMVALMVDNTHGWADVQCGYWAALYSLLFDLKAGVAGYDWAHHKMTEIVLLLGLASLFRQDGDALRLSELIEQHFSWKEALGDRIQSGRKILQSILEPQAQFTAAELLKDRKECCQKRDAWPTRPTAVDPFGVLDIETMLRFPHEAAFHFDGEFKPTNDDQITKAIVAYHSWYDKSPGAGNP